MLIFLLIFWSWCLVDILKIKFDQDLFLNLWYDLKKLLLQDELNPRVRCAFGNVYFQYHSILNNFCSEYFGFNHLKMADKNTNGRK